MKKFIALAALVALTTAAFAQSQDTPTLKFNGYFDSGAALFYNGTDSSPLGLWGNDAGKNGGRFNLDGAYGTADSGFKFEFRTETWNTSVAPVLKYGYVYANLFDKLVTVNAGLVKDGTWNTSGDAGYKPVDSEPGVQVIVKPAAGLTLGTFVNLPALGTAVAAGVAGAPYAGDVGLDFAGSYALDKTFALAAGLKSYPTTGEKYTTADKNGKNGLLEYYAGLGLLSVPNLTAVLEVKGTKVNDYALSGKTELVETLKYGLKDAGVEPATVGLIAYQWLYGDKQKDGTDALGLSYKLNPWASYKVDGTTSVKFGASYIAGNEVSVTAASDSKFTVAGQAPVAFKAGYKKNTLALFQVKPEVSFALSPALTVSTWYAYTVSVGADDVYYFNSGDKKTDLHALVVDFLYKF